MCMKSDILIQGVSNAEQSYAKCPNCSSVDLKILYEDDDLAHLMCLKCGNGFFKTKL